MGADATSFVQASFDLIAPCAAVESLAGLEALLAPHFGRCGVEHFAMARVPPVTQARMEPQLLINRWPPGWIEYYDGRQYLRHDPIIARLVTATDPFAWSEAPVDRRLRPVAFDLMHEAAEAGLAQGYTLPITDPSGFQGCVTLAGRELDLRDEVRRALHMTCLFAYAAGERLMGAALRAEREPLTERESEVLRWIASGKTQSEVGTILGISARTVEVHLRAARTKLRTTNTVHTAVVALQRREIRL